MVKTISTKNEEVDRQTGGGIPVPSLILIEGEHGSGKSSIVAQFMKGMLAAQMKVLYITTESTIREYFDKMKMITFDFKRDYLMNTLSVLPINIDGMKWTESLTKEILPVLARYIGAKSKEIDAIVIDSLSVLVMNTETNIALNFISKCKSLVSNGKTVIMTIHPKAISDDLSVNIRSTCDGYLKLSSANIAGRGVKVMEIVKLLGSSGQVSSQFSFDVDQLFGIKIVPLSMTNS